MVRLIRFVELAVIAWLVFRIALLIFNFKCDVDNEYDYIMTRRNSARLFCEEVCHAKGVMDRYPEHLSHCLDVCKEVKNPYRSAIQVVWNNYHLCGIGLPCDQVLGNFVKTPSGVILIVCIVIIIFYHRREIMKIKHIMRLQNQHDERRKVMCLEPVPERSMLYRSGEKILNSIWAIPDAVQGYFGQSYKKKI